MEKVEILFKFKRGERVRDATYLEDRSGVIDTRSYYECGIAQLSGNKYCVKWDTGGFTVPIREEDLEAIS